MRALLLASSAALTLIAAPTLTHAACNITDEKMEQELSQVKGISSGDFGNVRRDVRTLRSAATVLQRYGKDEACQQVVATMADLLRDPKASMEMRNKSASTTSSTTGQPADTAQAPEAPKTDAGTTASTNPAATSGQPATTSEQSTTTAEAPAPAQPPKTDAETTASTDPAATPNQPATTTEAPSDPQTTASTDPAPTTEPTQSMTMEQRRTNAVPFMERKTVMSAAELIGTDVYGTDNNSIGEIEDVIVSPENEPSYALVSYGGFLGIGEDQAAVPVSVLRVSADNYIFIPMTAEQLKGAPKLKRGTADWWTNDSFRSQNDQYYTSMK